MKARRICLLKAQGVSSDSDSPGKILKAATRCQMLVPCVPITPGVRRQVQHRTLTDAVHVLWHVFLLAQTVLSVMARP